MAGETDSPGTTSEGRESRSVSKEGISPHTPPGLAGKDEVVAPHSEAAEGQLSRQPAGARGDREALVAGGEDAVDEPKEEGGSRWKVAGKHVMGAPPAAEDEGEGDEFDALKHRMGKAFKVLLAAYTDAHGRSVQQKKDHEGNGDVQRAELLSKRSVLRSLKQTVDFKISQGANYRQLLMFGLLILLYAMSVSTRDTESAFAVETSLLNLMKQPLQGKESHLEVADVYSYISHIATATFRDPICGDGVCDSPLEYPGFSSIGCSADCGPLPNTSTLFFVTTDSHIPGQNFDQQLIYQMAAQQNSLPDFRMNIFVEATRTFLWEQDRQIMTWEDEARASSAEVLTVEVPDGNVSVCIFQRNKLYGTVATPATLAGPLNIDPATMPPAPASKNYDYGSLGEGLAWNSWVKTNLYCCNEMAPMYNPNTTTHPALDQGLPYGIGYIIGLGDPGSHVELLGVVPECQLSAATIAAAARPGACSHGNYVWPRDEQCYDAGLWEQEWAASCPMCRQFQVRKHSNPGDPIPRVKPEKLPTRPVTPGNNLISSVLISQMRRKGHPCQPLECDRNDSVCIGYKKMLGSLLEGQNCASGELDSEPFGIDPMFLTSSPLFDGRISNSSEYYNDSEVNPESGLPFGFFASPYEFPLGENHFFNPDSGIPYYRAYLDSRMSSKLAHRGVEFLREGKFIDNGTQRIAVEAGTFNPQLKHFAWSVAVFDFDLGGTIQVSYLVESFAMADLEFDDYEVVLMCFIIILCAWMMWVELKEMGNHWKQGGLCRYFADFWNLLDLSTILLLPSSVAGVYLVGLTLKDTLGLGTDGIPKVLDNTEAVARIFRTVEAEERAYLDIRNRVSVFVGSVQILRSWVGFNMLLLMARFFKMLHFQGRMGLVTRTFTNSAVDIIHFSIIFGVVVCLYAVLAQLMYGAQIAEFRSLGKGMMMLIMTTLTIGIGDYDRMLAMSPRSDFITTIFWLTFLFLSTVVLLNIFLAILVEGYTVVKETATNSETLVGGYVETFSHDLQDVQERILSHPCTAMLRGKHRTRFVSNRRVEQLLEAWLWYYDTLVEGSAAGEAAKEDAGARVIRLSDGEEMSMKALTLTLLELIEEAPERITTFKKSTWKAMANALQSVSLSAQVTPTATSDGHASGEGPDVESQAQPGDVRPSKSLRSSTLLSNAAFWEALRQEVGTEGDDGRVEEGGRGLGRVQSGVELTGEAKRLFAGSKKMAGVAQQMMSRYGDKPQDEQQAEEALKILKAQLMEKQIEQFRRVCEIERQVSGLDKRFQDKEQRDRMAAESAKSRMDSIDASLKEILGFLKKA